MLQKFPPERFLNGFNLGCQHASQHHFILTDEAEIEARGVAVLHEDDQRHLHDGYRDRKLDEDQNVTEL